MIDALRALAPYIDVSHIGLVAVPQPDGSVLYRAFAITTRNGDEPIELGPDGHATGWIQKHRIVDPSGLLSAAIYQDATLAAIWPRRRDTVRGMRSQSGAGMSGKEARAFQKSIRSGLAETAEAVYRDKLRAINEQLARQRAECSEETQQIRERLDDALVAERLALAAASRDPSCRGACKVAARDRVRLAKEHKRASSTQKKRSCKIEADGIRERRAAEKAHHAELRRLKKEVPF